MRRKDREMDKEFGIKIIDRAQYGIVSMIDEDNQPYGLPLSIVRDGESLYFHSAMDGKKVRALANNLSISVTFVGEVSVPDFYTKDQLDEITRDKSAASLLASKVFTTEFESALVKGKAKLIEDEEERIRAMKLICKKYTPSKMDYFNVAIESGLKRTNVYKIEIEEIRSKRKRFDKNGEEMKYGRME